MTCLTTGCVNVADGDMGQIYKAARAAWSGGKKVSLEEAASVPYASIGVKLDGSTQIMLVLASDAAGRQLWTSSARIAITTDHGRIVQTAGLEHNLGALGAHHMASDLAGGAVHWDADFPDLGFFSIPITCQQHLVGDETIVVLGKSIQTHRIDESCAAEGAPLNWSFKNTYWRDPASGLAWRTVQHIHPRLGAIEIEMLRPPA